MVTVNSCCCFSVETGGLILGWIGIIGNAIGGLFLLAMLAGYNALTCEDILQNEQFQEAFPDWTMENCQFLKTIILVGIIVGIVSNLIAFIIYVMLVRGIKTVSLSINLILSSWIQRSVSGTAVGHIDLQFKIVYL
ncbi:hypothetical protein ACKWTF_004233 [Chironomus riparius]